MWVCAQCSANKSTQTDNGQMCKQYDHWLWLPRSIPVLSLSPSLVKPITSHNYRISLCVSLTVFTGQYTRSVCLGWIRPFVRRPVINGSLKQPQLMEEAPTGRQCRWWCQGRRDDTTHNGTLGHTKWLFRVARSLAKHGLTLPLEHCAHWSLNLASSNGQDKQRHRSSKSTWEKCCCCSWHSDPYCSAVVS